MSFANVCCLLKSRVGLCASIADMILHPLILHLGHTISMRKLRQFQDLGHDVTFLIGSYTALVGDPSDKNKARPVLTEEKVAENAVTYAEQAFRVLDREKTKIRYNGEWLSKLSLVDLIRLGTELHRPAVFGARKFCEAPWIKVNRSTCMKHSMH
jgi:hypothetical protein